MKLFAALLLVVGMLFVATPAEAAKCSGGQYQRQVGSYLMKDRRFGTTNNDCVQTAGEKAAIKKWQAYNAITADGVAGPRSYKLAVWLSEAFTYAGSCSASSKTVCVDLTHQVAFIRQGTRFLNGPWPIRSGARWSDGTGGPTPVGLYKVTHKKQKTKSIDFGAYMYYWQGFQGCGPTNCSVGLHQATTPMYDPSVPGSHGCVNLLPTGARDLWNSTTVGTYVRTYGTKTGRKYV